VGNPCSIWGVVVLHQKLERRVDLLSTENQLERLKKLLEPNKNLTSYKLKDEECIRIEGTKESLDVVQEEILNRHHDLNVTGRKDTCLRVCLRPPFSQLMSDKVHKHAYASMED
jgi:hypothetical protein